MALPHRVAKKSLPMPIGVLYVASRVALAGLRYATLSPLITLWERRNPESPTPIAGIRRAWGL
jgi:hypothetical protein